MFKVVSSVVLFCVMLTANSFAQSEVAEDKISKVIQNEIAYARLQEGAKKQRDNTILDIMTW